jgi:hypothetical protein
MPIAAGLSTLQSQFISALSMRQGAQTQITASMISSAIASAAPMGLFPVIPTPVPLIPTGTSAGISMIQQALSMRQGAQISITSRLIANGVSLIAPTAPPVGLSLLGQQIESALSMRQGAQIQMVASILAQAVVTYYTSGGVI